VQQVRERERQTETKILRERLAGRQRDSQNRHTKRQTVTVKETKTDIERYIERDIRLK